MRKETKKIIGLSAREVLRFLGNACAAYGLVFSKGKSRRYELDKCLEEYARESSEFLKKVRYLKMRGYINQYCEGKAGYIEITKEGIDHLSQIDIECISVVRPAEWDKKWRIVIFDIPEKEKVLRNMIRRKLYQIGFLQIQKSVFIFPFECTSEVNLICDNYGGRKYLKYLIADIIEGENDIIEKFLNNGTLSKTDLV